MFFRVESLHYEAVINSERLITAKYHTEFQSRDEKNDRILKARRFFKMTRDNSFLHSAKIRLTEAVNCVHIHITNTGYRPTENSINMTFIHRRQKNSILLLNF